MCRPNPQHFLNFFFTLFLVFLKQTHSLIRGVLIHSCPAGPKNFTNYVFCHEQFQAKVREIIVPLKQNFENSIFTI